MKLHSSVSLWIKESSSAGRWHHSEENVDSEVILLSDWNEAWRNLKFAEKLNLRFSLFIVSKKFWEVRNEILIKILRKISNSFLFIEFFLCFNGSRKSSRKLYFLSNWNVNVKNFL